MEMNFLDLPEECIATMISFTSPFDACRISAVSKLLRSAADSNTTWERFLPSDYRMYIDNSLSRFSNKQLFLRFCESPLLIEDGRTVILHYPMFFLLLNNMHYAGLNSNGDTTHN